MDGVFWAVLASIITTVVVQAWRYRRSKPFSITSIQFNGRERLKEPLSFAPDDKLVLTNNADEDVITVVFGGHR
jgi:hypothetical protein